MFMWQRMVWWVVGSLAVLGAAAAVLFWLAKKGIVKMREGSFVLKGNPGKRRSSSSGQARTGANAPVRRTGARPPHTGVNAHAVRPASQPLTPRQKEQQERLLREKQDRALAILKQKQTGIAQNRCAEEKDSAISREYWKTGGIRFFAEQLRKRLQVLSPDATPEQMGVDLFNSAIMPARIGLENVRKKQQEVQLSIPSDEELMETVKAMDVDLYLARHEQEQAEEKAYVCRNEALLTRLIELFEGEDASALAPDAGTDQENCHQCAQRLKLRVEALLEDYAVPM